MRYQPLFVELCSASHRACRGHCHSSGRPPFEVTVFRSGRALCHRLMLPLGASGVYADSPPQPSDERVPERPGGISQPPIHRHGEVLGYKHSSFRRPDVRAFPNLIAKHMTHRMPAVQMPRLLRLREVIEQGGLNRRPDAGPVVDQMLCYVIPVCNRLYVPGRIERLPVLVQDGIQ